MRILRVFNNNVVLATGRGAPEVVVTGRGVGFGASPGDEVDESKITRIFVPEDENAATLAADVPLWFIELSGSVTDGLDVPSSTVLALADHLHMAVRRQEIQPQDRHPLEAEVRHLYPDELEMARGILSRVNRRLTEKGTPELPPEEAVAIALHLVNAGFHTGDLRTTYEMTGIFSQLFDVVDSAYDISVDRRSANAARFITHMRYLFVRLHENSQLDDGFPTLRDSLAQSHPEAVNCSNRIADLLEMRFGAELSGDERSYLALHVTRLTR